MNQQKTDKEENSNGLSVSSYISETLKERSSMTLSFVHLVNLFEGIVINTLTVTVLLKLAYLIKLLVITTFSDKSHK